MTDIAVSNAPIAEETPNYIKVSKDSLITMLSGYTIKALKSKPISSATNDRVIERAYAVKNMYRICIDSVESVDFSEYKKAVYKYFKEHYPNVRLNHTIMNIDTFGLRNLYCTVYELDKRVSIRPNKSHERKKNKQAILDTFIMPTVDIILYKYGLRRDKNSIHLTTSFINATLTEAVNKVLAEISEAGIILDNPNADFIVFKGHTANTKQNRLATIKGITSPTKFS